MRDWRCASIAATERGVSIVCCYEYDALALPGNTQRAGDVRRTIRRTLREPDSWRDQRPVRCIRPKLRVVLRKGRGQRESAPCSGGSRRGSAAQAAPAEHGSLPDMAMEAIVAAVWPEWLRHGGEAAAGGRRLESGETVLDGTAFPSAFALFMMQVSVIIALSRIIGFVLKPVSLSLSNTRAHRPCVPRPLRTRSHRSSRATCAAPRMPWRRQRGWEARESACARTWTQRTSKLPRTSVLPQVKQPAVVAEVCVARAAPWYLVLATCPRQNFHSPTVPPPPPPLQMLAGIVLGPCVCVAASDGHDVSGIRRGVSSS